MMGKSLWTALKCKNQDLLKFMLKHNITETQQLTSNHKNTEVNCKTGSTELQKTT